MKKFFSVSVGLVLGVLSFLMISYIYKGISGLFTTNATTTFANTSAQFSGNNFRKFGSGAKNFGSGGRPGMMGSGNFGGGTGWNGTGDFKRGSGAMMGTGRRNLGTGNITAQELFNQDSSQQ